MPAETVSQPLALYFDLYQGQSADLEVISEAAIEFVKALKEAARALDDQLEIRIELKNGEEGSLSLNSILRAVGGKKITRAALVALAMTAGSWFKDHTGEWAFDKALDFIASELGLPEGKEPPESKVPPHLVLSDEDAKRIAEQIVKLKANPGVHRHIGNFYRTIQHDPAVKAVGVKLNHNKTRPSLTVARNDFQRRSLDAKTVELVPTMHQTVSREVVGLISPVLDPTSRRRWFVTPSTGRATAMAMEDREFVARLNDGRVTTTLHSGLKLDVEIRTDEKEIEGVKTIVGRSIIRVYQIVLPAGSAETFSSTDGEEQGEGE